MKRLAIIIVTIAVLAAACESGGPSSLGRAPGAGSGTTRNATPSTTTPTTSSTPASTTPSATVAPTTTPAAKPFTFEVWLSYRDRLFVTKRTEPFVPPLADQGVTHVMGWGIRFLLRCDLHRKRGGASHGNATAGTDCDLGQWGRGPPSRPPHSGLRRVFAEHAITRLGSLLDGMWRRTVRCLAPISLGCCRRFSCRARSWPAGCRAR